MTEPHTEVHGDGPLRRWVAAGFGSGWIPRRLWGSDRGAGTFGAVVGGLIGIVAWRSPLWVDVMIAVLVIAVSVWASAPASRRNEDPGWIVIDEVAGALVAVIGMAGLAWFVAWGVARLADIFKVLPGVKRAEALPAPIGITADDVVAGLYGLAAGAIVTWLV
ncbi:MAG TPA: phosphatidylglycerophosphatase A [Acidimicrobiia bacterium]|nr:phosphatidylglycerophosphatase A [Acidimicrobiia bacterium]